MVSRRTVQQEEKRACRHERTDGTRAGKGREPSGKLLEAARLLGDSLDLVGPDWSVEVFVRVMTFMPQKTPGPVPTMLDTGACLQISGGWVRKGAWEAWEACPDPTRLPAVSWKPGQASRTSQTALVPEV